MDDMKNKKSSGILSSNRIFRCLFLCAAATGWLVFLSTAVSAYWISAEKGRSSSSFKFAQSAYPGPQIEEAAQAQGKIREQGSLPPHSEKSGPQHKTEESRAVKQTDPSASHEGEHETHGDGAGFLAKVLNFLVLFGGLFILLRKPIGKMLGQRAEDIRTSMAEAEESHKNAQEKLEQGQRRLDEMAVEVLRIKEEAEEAGRRDNEEILGAARQEVERIKKFAAQEINQLSQGGMKELKSFAAETATELARENIKKRIKSSDQARLIDEAIERLDSLLEQGRQGTGQ